MHKIESGFIFSITQCRQLLRWIPAAIYFHYCIITLRKRLANGHLFKPNGTSKNLSFFMVSMTSASDMMRD